MAIELSLDLVEEILSRVPAKSLASWRYVCKQWKTLITDPRFVKKHLSHFRCLEQQFTVFNNITDTKFRSFNVSCTVSSSKLSLVGIDDNNDIPSLNLQVFNPQDLLVTCVSHCNGLLLLVTRFKLLVWNPLLKEGRWIKSDTNSDDENDMYGLGYTSDQSYKIVRFHYYHTSYQKEVGIYDFSSDRWKKVVDQTFDEFLVLQLSSVCLRGTPYWLGYAHNKILIRSFDFSKERFEPLCLPPEKTGYVFSLGIYRGDQLLMMHESSEGKIHIWVMKKQWSMLMTITDGPPISLRYGCLGYSIENNGKLVLPISLCQDTHVSIYVMGEERECKTLEYHFITGRISSACHYVPSLLPVPKPVKERRKRNRFHCLV